MFLIDCAGIVEQDAPRPVIEVLRPVRVSEGDAWVELRPARSGGFEMALTIDFAAAAIGRQSVSLRLTPGKLPPPALPCPYFALSEEIEQLRAAGLARGGSLDNAVVVDGDRILNPGGLRMEHEFARHKLLDQVGDLALAGAAIHGRLSPIAPVTR